jgi:hypothetical protein
MKQMPSRLPLNPKFAGTSIHQTWEREHALLIKAQEMIEEREAIAIAVLQRLVDVAHAHLYGAHCAREDRGPPKMNHGPSRRSSWR